MAQNVSLWGASYPAVPQVVLPKTGGGTAVFTDVSDTTANAGDVLSSKAFYGADGTKKTGSVSSKAAATYNTKSSDQTIAAGQYLSGKQTIRGVKTENIDAGKIKHGVVVKVGDSESAGRIKNVTGTFTKASTATGTHGAAAAGQIMNGYSAWVDGAEVVGTFDMFALTVNELKALQL